MIEIKNDTWEARKCVSFSNVDLSYWQCLNVYFDIICADIVYPPRKK